MKLDTIHLPGLGDALIAAYIESFNRKAARLLGVPYIGGGAADAWQVYGSFIEKLGNKVIDLDADTFKIFLATSGYTPDASAHDEVADLGANEASNYTRPTLTVSWVRSGTTVTFDASDPTITASGGNCVFRYLVIYDDTPAGDPLVCYQLLDNTPADVTILNGNSLLLQLHANGILRGLPA